MNTDDEKKPVDDRSRDLSPGKLLVWGRERSNLTQEQVATALYMTLTKVKALESDDYRYMGSSTFIRGYLRAYANLVHLDVPQVLAAYDRHLQKLGAVETPALRRMESANKPIWQFGIFILIALVVLWLISIWFFDNRQQPVVDRPANVTPQLDISHPIFSSVSSMIEDANGGVIADESVGASSESTLFSSSRDGVLETQANSSVSSDAGSNLNQVSKATKESSVVRNNGLAVLTLSFNAECWLEVSDARGDVLAADLQAAGRSLQLKGEAPFDVKLGNAPAAKIEFNGELVAVTTLPATNVLSLKVGR